MRVIATLQSPGNEPVEMPYTTPDASPIQAMHAVATLLSDQEDANSQAPFHPTLLSIRIDIEEPRS